MQVLTDFIKDEAVSKETNAALRVLRESHPSETSIVTAELEKWLDTSADLRNALGESNRDREEKGNKVREQAEIIEKLCDWISFFKVYARERLVGNEFNRTLLDDLANKSVEEYQNSYASDLTTAFEH
jgi:hypothetical protein